LNRWKKKNSPKFPKKNALILGPTDKEEKVRRGKKEEEEKGKSLSGRHHGLCCTVELSP
jgi:hypothetical protein